MKHLIAGLALALAASVAIAQQTQFIVSSGAASGSTYTQMTNELMAICADVPIRRIDSTGAIENLDRIAGNKVNGAIVQTDILWLRGKTDNLSNVKTLIALHPEEVHAIVRTAGVKKTGIANTFSARLQPRDISETREFTVGAWGASEWSARIISELNRFGWNVVKMPDAATAWKELAADRVDMVIAVAGAPAGSVAGLDSGYRLLRFDAGTREALKDVYVPAKISYSNLSSVGVETVATEALLVTQDYKSRTYVQLLRSLRTCLAQNIDNLREAVGTHPKWKSVDVANRGKWPGYWEGK